MTLPYRDSDGFPLGDFNLDTQQNNSTHTLKTVDGTILTTAPEFLFNEFFSFGSQNDLMESPAPKTISDIDMDEDDQVVVTATAHGYSTGDKVVIRGAEGATGANGLWAIEVVDADSFILVGCTGIETYTEGGKVYAAYTLEALDGIYRAIKTFRIISKGDEASNITYHGADLSANGGFVLALYQNGSYLFDLTVSVIAPYLWSFLFGNPTVQDITTVDSNVHLLDINYPFNQSLVLKDGLELAVFCLSDLTAVTEIHQLQVAVLRDFYTANQLKGAI